MYVKTDDPKLLRDTNSNAIINNDENGYKQYLRARQLNKTMTQMQAAIESLQKRIEILNDKVNRLEQKNG